MALELQVFARGGTMVETFRDLIVWQKAMDLVVLIYKESEQFPASEKFGLTSQIRRAAVSIPSNVAEGKATGGQNYRRHLKTALGSEAELYTQLEFARRLGLLNDTEAGVLFGRLSEVGRMITALLKALPKQ